MAINRVSRSPLLDVREVEENDNVVTMKSLMDMARAIYDRTREVVREVLSETETGMTLRLGKSFDGMLDKGFHGRLNKAIEDALSTKMVEFEQWRNKELSEAMDAHRKHLDHMEKKYEEKVDFLHRAYESSLEQIRGLLQNLTLPTPVISVVIPEQKPPDIHLTLPEQIPMVTVHVPEYKNPDIHLTSPEMRAPDIVINVPPPRRIKKNISYDQHGRPTEIEEVEM